MSNSIKTLTIHSKDRVTGTPESFMVAIPTLSNLAHIELLTCKIPNTIYNIGTGASINFDDGGAQVATLTPGCYSITNLIAEIKTQMDAVSAQTFTVTYSAITLMITIASTGNFSMTMSGLDLGTTIGFTTNTASAASHTGDKVVNLTGIDNIYLDFSEFGSFVRGSNPMTHSTFILCKETIGGSVEIYNSFKYQVSACYQSGTISSLNVRLKDDNGSTVDLNGSEWTCTFSLFYK